jgi:hypothetical protein
VGSTVVSSERDELNQHIATDQKSCTDLEVTEAHRNLKNVNLQSGLT